MSMFDNGADAMEAIYNFSEKAKSKGKQIHEYVSAVVTDIEMPQLDGLTLCKRTKQEFGLSNLPIIIFSSLVNEMMIEKCKAVGADRWANKLKTDDLIHILD